ncbi:MAG: hypothetical protein IT577_03625 [Verrucomicrobiae bacterium]|nr:hypothetical protein [Verrucomicrobiae bacterium]
MRSTAYLLALVAALCAGVAPAADEQVKPVTGLQARDIAAKAIAPEHRANVIAILGPRVDTYTAPLDWYVWFYVPDAAQQGRRVHVVGDQVRDVKEGVTEVRRIRFAPYKSTEVIPAADMAADTAQILGTVRDLAPLKDLKIVGSSFELRQSPSHGQPVWSVDVHVLRGGSVSKFGRVIVAARNGQVLAIQQAE